MKILFIGGTEFVGRQMVEDALKAGHDICILQRGKTNVSLFPQAKRYLGDRNSIDQIIPQIENFDMVIDTCGYHPEVVKKSSEFLKGKTQLYIFISTCSVYSDFSKPGLNETSPLSHISDIPSVEAKITNENYGPLKVLCEKEVLNTFGANKSLILRPTIIVGPHDNTNRFNFWIKAIMSNEKVEAPDDLDAFIQFLDVRALSQFALESLTKKRSGTYNLVGPKKPIKFSEFINKVKELLNPACKIDFNSNTKDKSFPMYVNDFKSSGFFQINGENAYRDGLQDISVEDTILNTAAFLKG